MNIKRFHFEISALINLITMTALDQYATLVCRQKANHRVNIKFMLTESGRTLQPHAKFLTTLKV